MATATKSKDVDTAQDVAGKESTNGSATETSSKTIELSPTYVQAFQALRGAGDVGTVIGTVNLDTKTIRGLEAAGVLEVTEQRRQGKGYAPTSVKLLVDTVQGNPDLEPKTRKRRETAAAPARSKAVASSATDEAPTVEDMKQLLAAIEHAEIAASEEVSAEAKKSLDEAWVAFSKLKPGAPDFAAAYERFTSADAGLKNSAGDARKNAFAAVRSDAKHAKIAKYLRLLNDRT